MENIEGIIYFLIYFFSGYSIVCGLVSIISLWKIFLKENIPGYYSVIPFYNVYRYFKICGLPFWTIFIPVINVICLLCSTYIITKKYRCERWQSILSIFFPFVFMPYIAFSDKRNIDFVVDNLYVKNMADIDELEIRLEKDDFKDFNSDYISNTNSTINNIVEKDSFIDKIEDGIVSDEYVYDDAETIKEQDIVVPSVNDFDNNEFIEINDDIVADGLSLNGIDKLEKKIEVENSVEKKIETNIQEFKEVEASKEAIAFGGKQKIENVDSVQTKHDELKCARCGSSLVGAAGFCPGCGAKI